MVDVTKPALLVALEYHHLVGPDAPVGKFFAKAFRNGAQIFPDHHAAMRYAFLRRYSQQRLERHLHVDALVGGKTLWNEIEPLQTQHMGKKERAGGTPGSGEDRSHSVE